jgi:hypothetical protein
MKVIIKKQIHGEFASASSKDTWLKKEIELPFAPFKGLEIYLGDFEATLEEITWNGEEFTCYTESDKEIYDARLHKTKHRPMKEIVDEWLKDGWELDD